MKGCSSNIKTRYCIGTLLNFVTDDHRRKKPLTWTRCVLSYLLISILMKNWLIFRLTRFANDIIYEIKFHTGNSSFFFKLVCRTTIRVYSYISGFLWRKKQLRELNRFFYYARTIRTGSFFTLELVVRERITNSSINIHHTVIFSSRLRRQFIWRTADAYSRIKLFTREIVEAANRVYQNPVSFNVLVLKIYANFLPLICTL